VKEGMIHMRVRCKYEADLSRSKVIDNPYALHDVECWIDSVSTSSVFSKLNGGGVRPLDCGR